MKSLTDSEVQSKLSEIPGWSIQQKKLHRNFEFKTFVEAFGFMSQSALVAEKMDHHPEWSNVYNRVSVDLTTHDAHGITERDFKLALAMNQISAKI